jgi:hypothetical protein
MVLGIAGTAFQPNKRQPAPNGNMHKISQSVAGFCGFR